MVVSAIQREGGRGLRDGHIAEPGLCAPDACMEIEKKGRKNKMSCCSAACWDRPGWQSRHDRAKQKHGERESCLPCAHPGEEIARPDPGTGTSNGQQQHVGNLSLTDCTALDGKVGGRDERRWLLGLSRSDEAAMWFR